MKSVRCFRCNHPLSFSESYIVEGGDCCPLCFEEIQEEEAQAALSWLERGWYLLFHQMKVVSFAVFALSTVLLVAQLSKNEEKKTLRRLAAPPPPPPPGSALSPPPPPRASKRRKKCGGCWEKKRAKHLLSEQILPTFEALKPLHLALKEPKPGDWLNRYQEYGQSFHEYILATNPIRPNKTWKTIYLQLLGKFSPQERRIAHLTADYLSRFFSLPVKIIKDPLSLSLIPQKARRIHPTWGIEQLNTNYLLHQVMEPRRPWDAVAYFVLTTHDLWPGKGWNFVYGYAMFYKRIGVGSICRHCPRLQTKRDFRRCLRRTIKMASHELGHIFSLRHCIAYNCSMNGVNHRKEADSRPLALCPLCLQKLCWNVRCDPSLRFERLAAFCKKQGLLQDYRFFLRSLRLLKAHQQAQEESKHPQSSAVGD